jgi:hypothetical protein
MERSSRAQHAIRATHAQTVPAGARFRDSGNGGGMRAPLFLRELGALGPHLGAGLLQTSRAARSEAGFAESLGPRTGAVAMLGQTS